MTAPRSRVSPARQLAKRCLLAVFNSAPALSLRCLAPVEQRNPQLGSILRGMLFRTQVERLQGVLRAHDYPNEIRLTSDTCFVHMTGLDLDARLVDRYFLLRGEMAAVSQGNFLHDRLVAKGITVATFVDLGANFGEYSLWFAKNTRASILAVEPSTENLALLEANAVRNGVDLARITLVRKAVSDRPGTVEITKGRSQGNSIVNLSGNTETVSSDSLDNLLQAHGIRHIDCLKIDIEGAEPLLLADLSKWVPRIDSLLIEMGGGLAPNSEYDTLCRLFEEGGFECELFPSGQPLNMGEVRRLIRTEHHDYLFYRAGGRAA
jgi:FkbM family methyltransferase